MKLKKPRKPKDFVIGTCKISAGYFPRYIEALTTEDFIYMSTKKFKQLRRWLDRAIPFMEFYDEKYRKGVSDDEN
jgi:hypothetical protein